MSKKITDKLKKKALEQVSLLDALKEILPVLGEIRLEKVNYQNKEYHAMLIRGKDEKEKPAKKRYKTNPISFMELLNPLHGTAEVIVKVIKYVEREWLAVMVRDKEDKE